MDVVIITTSISLPEGVSSNTIFLKHKDDYMEVRKD
jgi:hypothetical protein